MSIAAQRALERVRNLERVNTELANQVGSLEKLKEVNAALEDLVEDRTKALENARRANERLRQDGEITSNANRELRAQVLNLNAQCDELRVECANLRRADGEPRACREPHASSSCNGPCRARPTDGRAYFKDEVIGARMIQSLSLLTGLPAELLQTIGASHVAAEAPRGAAGVAGGLVISFGLAKECSVTVEASVAAVAEQLRRIALAGAAATAVHATVAQATQATAAQAVAGGRCLEDDASADLTEVISLGFINVQFTDRMLGEAWKALVASLCDQKNFPTASAHATCSHADSAFTASAHAAAPTLPLPAKAAQLLHALQTRLPAAVDGLVQKLDVLTAHLALLTGQRGRAEATVL